MPGAVASREFMLTEPPAEIRDRIIQEAAERDVSVNEVAIGILAARYRIQRDPSPMRYQPLSSPNRLNLYMPDDLRRAIRLHAAEVEGTMRGVVLQAWAEHYGIEAPPVYRRPRGGPQ